jgi:hypothetical protein
MNFDCPDIPTAYYVIKRRPSSFNGDCLYLAENANQLRYTQTIDEAAKFSSHHTAMVELVNRVAGTKYQRDLGGDHLSIVKVQVKRIVTEEWREVGE